VEYRPSSIPYFIKQKKGGLSSFAHASLETRPRSIPYFIKQKKGGPLLLRKCFGGISAKFYSVFHETKKRGAFPPSQMLRWNIGQVVLLCIIKQKKGGPFLLRTCFVGNSATFYSVFLKTKKGGPFGTPLLHQSTSY
jgi:hypothetical protein